MKEFDFLLGLMLAEHILKHTDNLSKTIHTTAMPAVEARGLSKLCIQVISGEKLSFNDIHQHFKSLSTMQLSLVSKVTFLVKLILLMPATNVVS